MAQNDYKYFEEFGKYSKNGVDSRLINIPLDETDVFLSLEDAKKYAKGVITHVEDITDWDDRYLAKTAYPGQIIAVRISTENPDPTKTPVDNNKPGSYQVYQIQGDGSLVLVNALKGETGEKGPKGDPGGATGITGAMGMTGVRGITGPQGMTGERGITGERGLRGETGPAGYRGTTGVRGITGANGDRGPQGYQGITGLQGKMGPQGVTGVAGVQGITGYQGYRGQTGYPGVTGATGVTGAMGMTGVRGITGERGITGAVGARGATGPGVQGCTGEQGVRGITGERGIQGPRGITGPMGEIGDRGPQGITGVTGVQGRTGLQGITGIQGQPGITGVRGFTGPTGVQGITGVYGVQGRTGVQGITGVTGARGYQGITGAKGQQGITGERGVQGYRGITGPDGYRGITGIQGITGVRGVQGNTGPAGYRGITGAKGPQGDPGGRTGLQGITGERGPIGWRGITGVRGMTGVRGVQGFIGPTGYRGITGERGITGPRGPQGDKGGATGVQGRTGLRGITGVQGKTGMQGYTGLQGITGIQGKTGLRGITGYQGITGLQGKTGVRGATGLSQTYTAGTNIDITNNIISSTVVSMVSTTHAELLAMVEGGTLVAGQQYRITDFVTTVANDAEARSAGHAFDLIVVADDESTLNAAARAIAHEGDTYFANADLSKWQVWYDIHNDTTRYQWADTTSGKGIIYRLIDEWQNDCPYDFKNVQFKRYKVTHDDDHDNLSSLDGYYLGTGGENYGLTTDTSDYVWCYTFDSIDGDVSVIAAGSDALSYASKRRMFNNVIAPYASTMTIDGDTYVVRCLNNITLCTQLNSEQSQHSLPNTCSIGGQVFNIGIVDAIALTIGYDTQNIIAGKCFEMNDLGAGGAVMTFGDYCNSNTFGNVCYSNTFGNECDSNTFGNGCYSNTFGTRTASVKTTKDYMRYISVESGVQYVNITCSATTSGSAYAQNAVVHSGVVGTSSTYKTCTISATNTAYLTEFGEKVQGTIS